MLILGESMHRWGKGGHGKSLYLLLNFLVNLKLKLKLLFRKIIQIYTKFNYFFHMEDIL